MLCDKILLNKTIQIIKQNNNKEKKNIQFQKQKQILCLDDSIDDDLHKIYFIKSNEKSIKGKYYRVIATAFGSTSCSCIDQTKNPYQNCEHMKMLDKIIEESSYKIHKTGNYNDLLGI
jgi:hypothetical protein